MIRSSKTVSRERVALAKWNCLIVRLPRLGNGDARYVGVALLCILVRKGVLLGTDVCQIKPEHQCVLIGFVSRKSPVPR